MNACSSELTGISGGFRGPSRLRSPPLWAMDRRRHSTPTVKHALQNTQNHCHQWLSHRFRVHQIRFRPGLRLGPYWRSLQRCPRPSVWFKGALLLRRRGGSGKERRGGKRKERGKEGEIPGSALECGWCGASRTTPNTNMTRKTKRYSD